MKILLFRTDPSIMNISTYNCQEIGMAKAYVEAGHVCDIVYYNGHNPSRVEQIDAGNEKTINIYWLRGFSILNNGFFFGINKLLKQYDMIQVSEYYFFSSWNVYKRYSKTKKVYIYQGVYDSDFSRKFNLRCKMMDPILLQKDVLSYVQVFTKSNLALNSMKKRGFQKIKTVGVGLDLSRFQEETETSEWVTNLTSKKGWSNYLLYVGVFEDRRNPLFLLDVLSLVVKKHPDTKLIMIGKGKPDYSSKVFQKIRELGLSNHIIYKESLQQKELSFLYKTADLFLLPSKYEIFGMVICEAMNFGLPVISSYNGGSSTMIQNRLNGIIINDFDPIQWSNEISNLLEDHYARVQMGRSAQQSAIEQFSWSAIVSEILSTMKNAQK